MNKRFILMTIVVAAVFIWSAVNPHDYFMWTLEVAPTMMGLYVPCVYRHYAQKNI